MASTKHHIYTYAYTRIQQHMAHALEMKKAQAKINSLAASPESKGLVNANAGFCGVWNLPLGQWPVLCSVQCA